MDSGWQMGGVDSTRRRCLVYCSYDASRYVKRNKPCIPAFFFGKLLALLDGKEHMCHARYVQ